MGGGAGATIETRAAAAVDTSISIRAIAKAQGYNRLSAGATVHEAGQMRRAHGARARALYARCELIGRLPFPCDATSAAAAFAARYTTTAALAAAASFAAAAARTAITPRATAVTANSAAGRTTLDKDLVCC